MDPTTSASLFKLFDIEKQGKITFEILCYGVSSYMLGSMTSRCNLLYQVFNYNQQHTLTGTLIQPLKDHCVKYLELQGDIYSLDMAILKEATLSKEEFAE